MAKRPVMVFYSITVAKDGDDQSSCFVYLSYYTERPDNIHLYYLNQCSAIFLHHNVASVCMEKSQTIMSLIKYKTINPSITS